jgi:hypothetical protein
MGFDSLTNVQMDLLDVANTINDIVALGQMDVSTRYKLGKMANRIRAEVEPSLADDNLVVAPYIGLPVSDIVRGLIAEIELAKQHDEPEILKRQLYVAGQFAEAILSAAPPGIARPDSPDDVIWMTRAHRDDLDAELKKAYEHLDCIRKVVIESGATKGNDGFLLAATADR